MAQHQPVFGSKRYISQKRLYITILLVIILSCFIMVVPQNLYHTISDSSFITYLGGALQSSYGYTADG